MALTHHAQGDPGHIQDHNDLSDHVNGTTGVHGIADTSLLLTSASLGTLSSQNASSVAITGGTIAGTTITGGSITGMTDITVADGGTGASNASGARTNLGVVIGTDVQAFNANLSAIAGLTTAADKLTYWTGSGTAAVATLSTFVRTLLDDADATTARATLAAQQSNANLSAIAGLTTANNLMTQWTGSGTASTVDITTDWQSQYAYLTGRVGGQVINGGTSGLESLKLSGNSSSTTAGFVDLRSPTRLRDIASETLTAEVAPLLRLRQTKTLDFASASFGGGAVGANPGLISFDATVQWNQSANTFGSSFISNTTTYQNVSTVVANLGSIASFNSRPTINAAGAAITFAPSADFFSRYTLSTSGGGALTPSGSGDLVGFEASLTIADAGVNWTAGGAGYTGFAVVAPTVTGGSYNQFVGFRVPAVGSPTNSCIGLSVGAMTCTGTTNVGVDIAAPSGATNNASLRAAGAILHTGTAGIGYTVGAGGSVTQATSRTTGVTLNKIVGAVTLFSAAGSAAFTTFTVTNSTIALNDNIQICQRSGTDKYQIFVTNVQAGRFDITFATTGGTTTEQPVFSFMAMKGTTT